MRLDAGIAIATANSEMACLKSLFTEAMDAGLCETNPVRAVRLKRPNNIRDRILSEAETARLFIEAERRDDYGRPLFFFLYFTGARLNEALSLTWRDIEHDHARVIIRMSKTGEGRIVPLHDRLQKELERWRPFSGGSRWVLPNPDNPGHCLQHVYKGWAALCKAAKVTDLTRHDLRHNFVSMLQAAGVSDSIIMSMTGHKTTATLHRYSHTNDQMKRDALAAFPQPTRKGEVVALHPAIADEKA